MDDMNELFNVEVESEKVQHKGAFLWFRNTFSGTRAFALGVGAVLALSAPVALLASRNSSPSASVETTVLAGSVETTTSLEGVTTSSSVLENSNKSSKTKKPALGLVLPIRGAAPTGTTTTTIATSESSTSTVAPPAPPIVLNPSTTIAPGSISRTITFGLVTPVLKTYGDVAFSVSLATPSVGGGEVSYSTSNAEVCVVSALSGEVSITGSGNCEISAAVPANGIYASATTSTNVSIAVSKASLTITASSASIAFSPRRYEVTASYSGFVNSENSSVLTSLPTCVVVKKGDLKTSSNDRNTYATSCSGAAALNYNISYVGGILSVSNWK